MDQLSALADRVLKRLLDALDDVHLVEQIDISVGLMGQAPTMTSSIGDNSQPSLLWRLEALDRTEHQYRELLEAGTPGRIVAQGVDGRLVLRGRLAAARGELLVFDPYFGCEPEDWNVLNDVTVPIRVLTEKATGRPPAPVNAPSLTCRRWRGRPPVHDRGYLWEGGGVSVGSSANGLGRRASLIDAMEPTIAAGWSRLFETWWNAPHVEPL